MLILNILVLSFNVARAISVTIGGGTHSSTACSKFDFEEKVLEKLVRFEHKIEIFERKLHKWEENIESKVEKIDKTEKKITRDIEIAIDNLNRELDKQKSILMYTLDQRGKTTDAYISSQMDRIDNAEENITQSVETLIKAVKEDIQSQVRIIQGAVKNVTDEVLILSHNMEIKYDNHIKAINETMHGKFKQMNESEISRNTTFQSFIKSTMDVLYDYRENTDRAIENLKKSANTTLTAFRQDQSNKVALTACAKANTYQSGSVFLFPYIHTRKGISSNGVTSLANTGKFVCERPGLYLITVFIMTNKDSSSVCLYKNSDLLAYNYFSMHHYYQTHSVSVLEQLNVNDSVYTTAGGEMNIFGEYYSCLTILQITD